LQDILETCLEILEATQDGEDLSPHHLQLVERGANHWLDEVERAELRQLADDVRLGYEKPWLHNIEYLTIDNDGVVSWKGEPVDHYSLNWAFSSAASEVSQRLAESCLELEKSGKPVTGRAVVLRPRQPE